MSYMLNQAIRKYGFRALPLAAGARYTVGRRYWCGYWCQWYDVEAATYDGDVLESVTVRWQDGECSTHCTPLDPRKDFELV